MTIDPANVTRAFEAIAPLPEADRALLVHVLMCSLNRPELLTEGLPQRLLNLPGLLRALPPEMLGLLQVALNDCPYIEGFLAGRQPEPFL